MQYEPTQTRVGEPGRVGVQVDVFYSDRQVGARPPRHADAHQRILLLRHHHHLKHPHRVGQREVKMLRARERDGVSQERNLILNVLNCGVFFISHRLNVSFKDS